MTNFNSVDFIITDNGIVIWINDDDERMLYRVDGTVSSEAWTEESVTSLWGGEEDHFVRRTARFLVGADNEVLTITEVIDDSGVHATVKFTGPIHRLSGIVARVVALYKGEFSVEESRHFDEKFNTDIIDIEIVVDDTTLSWKIGEYNGHEVGPHAGGAWGLFAYMGEDWTADVSSFGRLNWPEQVKPWIMGIAPEMRAVVVF